MSGFVLCTGQCIVCRGVFSYNPVRVPSTTVVTGKREPICQPCIRMLNSERQKRGLEAWPVAPDAYDACAEEELRL